VKNGEQLRMTVVCVERNQSVERRSSDAASGFAGSDLIGSILALSTRADISVCDASADRVGSGACSERGRDIARAISM